MGDMERSLEERFADAVVAKGLVAPAVFFLELHKPLTGLWMVGGEILSPLFSMLLGPKATEEVTKLFSSRESLERVLLLIEAKAANGSTERRIS